MCWAAGFRWRATSGSWRIPVRVMSRGPDHEGHDARLTARWASFHLVRGTLGTSDDGGCPVDGRLVDGRPVDGRLVDGCLVDGRLVDGRTNE